MATKGSATIYLELDKVRGSIRTWRNGNAGHLVQRTGWKRLLVLTKSLYEAGFEYVVRYEFIGPNEGSSEYATNGVPRICDGARMVAYVEWKDVELSN